MATVVREVAESPVHDLNGMSSIGRDALTSKSAASTSTNLKGSMTSGLEHDLDDPLTATTAHHTPHLLPQSNVRSHEESQLLSTHVDLDRLDELTTSFTVRMKKWAATAKAALSQLAAARTERGIGSSISKLPESVPSEIPKYRIDLRILRYLYREMVKFRQKAVPGMLAKSMKLETSLYESVMLSNPMTLAKAKQMGNQAIKLQKDAYDRMVAAHDAGLEPLNLKLDRAYASAEADLITVRDKLQSEDYQKLVREMREESNLRLYSRPTEVVRPVGRWQSFWDQL